MHDEPHKYELFTRRAFLLGFGKLGLTSILVGRLFYLQIIKGEDYKQLSLNNKTKSIWIKPRRGLVYDRNMNALARNVNEYKLFLDKDVLYQMKISSESILAKLFHIVDIESSLFSSLLKKIKNSSRTQPILILNDLDEKQLYKIEFHSYELPGFFVERDFKRFYPYKEFAHVIGYTGYNQNLKEKEISYFNLIRTGKSGIEKHFDSSLRGKFGTVKIEVDALNNFRKQLSSSPEIDGENINLSLSLSLQRSVAKILGNNSGAAIVMDCDSGEILSMISNPGYDPNSFMNGININEWNQLIKNPNLPLTNKCVSVAYPPGSIFKVLVALAALEEGISPYYVYNCSGKYSVGNREFHCWHKAGHGKLNLVEAIAKSCNPYFYNVANIIGIEKLKFYAQKFGFGVKNGIELPLVSSGLIPDKKWKLMRYNQSWKVGDTTNCAIGQGFILATPLQLAEFMAKIATGKDVKATIFSSKKKHKKLSVNSKNLDIVRQGLEKVINSPSGVAYKYRSEDLKFAGKTGTSQVLSKKDQNTDLSSESIPWEYRNHGLFSGYNLVGDRKVVVSIILEHFRAGSYTIPFAKKILHSALNNMV